MSLQIERIPTFSDNYTYLVICDETREAAVVDAPALLQWRGWRRLRTTH